MKIIIKLYWRRAKSIIFIEKVVKFQNIYINFYIYLIWFILLEINLIKTVINYMVSRLFDLWFCHTDIYHGDCMWGYSPHLWVFANTYTASRLTIYRTIVDLFLQISSFLFVIMAFCKYIYTIPSIYNLCLYFV